MFSFSTVSTTARSETYIGDIEQLVELARSQCNESHGKKHKHLAGGLACRRMRTGQVTRNPSAELVLIRHCNVVLRERIVSSYNVNDTSKRFTTGFL